MIAPFALGIFCMGFFALSKNVFQAFVFITFTAVMLFTGFVGGLASSKSISGKSGTGGVFNLTRIQTTAVSTEDDCSELTTEFHTINGKTMDHSTVEKVLVPPVCPLATAKIAQQLRDRMSMVSVKNQSTTPSVRNMESSTGSPKLNKKQKLALAQKRARMAMASDKKKVEEVKARKKAN